MESITRISGERSTRRIRTAARTVQGVADEWVTDGGEVDADLVRPTRLDLDVGQKALGSLLEDVDERSGRATAAIDGGVDCSEGWVGYGADRLRHRETGSGGRSRGEGAVALDDTAGAPGVSQSRSRPRGACAEHESRRVATETVHRHRFRVQAAHAVEQRALEKAGPGKRREARRFAHRQQVSIAVHHRDRGRCIRLAPRRPVPGESLSPAHEGVGVARPIVDAHPSRVDAPTPVIKARVGVAAGQIADEWGAVVMGADRLAIAEPAVRHLLRHPDLGQGPSSALVGHPAGDRAMITAPFGQLAAFVSVRTEPARVAAWGARRRR